MTLRNAFENLAVESKQDAANVTLGQIETNIGFTNLSLADMRANMPDKNGSFARVYPLPPIAYWASAEGGRVAFNATTDVVTLNVTQEQNLGAVTNPANSGKDMVLWAAEFSTSAQAIFRRYRNATVVPNQGAVARPVANLGGGSTTAVGQIWSGGTTPQYTRSGGTVSKTAHINAYSIHAVDLYSAPRLRPGQSIAWTLVGPGGLGGSMTASIYLEWYEIPAQP